MIDFENIDIIDIFNSKETFQNKEVLKNILINPQFKSQVLTNGMDLLDVICQNIEEKMVDFHNHDDIYCNLINFIAENGNPKEIICIVNFHLNKVKEDFKFLILLYPLSVALKRLDISKVAFNVILKESLNSAISIFKTLPVAHYKGLEGEELKVYIQTTETQRFLILSKAYLSFLDSLIRKTNFNDSKDEIFQNVLYLFDYSLIKLVFYSPGVVAEECRACSLKAFSLLEKLVICFHYYILDIIKTNSSIDERIKIEEDNEIKDQLKDSLIPYSSLVCLLYFVFVKQNFSKYPQIFLPTYNWSFCLPIISISLQKSNDPHVIRLCLMILEEFNNRIENSTVTWKSLHSSFFSALKIAMTSNFNREIRAFSFDVFINTYRKLTKKGRFKFLKIQLKTEADHFGYRGQLILLLKEEILDSILAPEGPGRYFLGGSIYPVIAEIFTLPDRDQTDVVNESEWILAALNMLYALILRDRKKHLVGIDVLIDDFHRSFLEPLGKAAELMLAQYQQERKRIEIDESSCTINEINPEFSFMDKAHKIDFIDKAVLTIELVRCNIGMVTSAV